ncbi:hypothetical protein L1049_006131 [Liquidambar formosana]|uniref:Cytochrome P450 n=1 Tax=Liquidambar formosana TaxID=63359 RepID=A0AAP0WT22_LIQFO
MGIEKAEEGNKKRSVAARPRGLPLIGYLPFIGADLHISFTKLAKVYGPIYKLRLGTKLCVVLSSPDLIKEVVRDHDVTFANRDPTVAASVFSNGGTDNAFAPYGSNWRMLLKILARQMLSHANLDASYALRRHEVRKAIRVVCGKIGKPIDVGKVTFSTVVNATGSMVWGGMLDGEKGSDQSGGFRAVVSELMVLLAKPNVSDFFPVLARLDIQGVERKTKKVTRWIERIFYFKVDQRMKMDMDEGEGSGKGEGKDFLQFLLQLKEQEATGTSITLAQIKALLADIMSGGIDTTASTAEWVMAEIIRHPRVMMKVHEELTNVVGENNNVEEFHIPKLVYLRAILKGALRLYPVAPLLIPRCPNKSCTVGGYTIPEGTRILVNVWAMHRDPNVWDSPLEFRPERFLTHTTKLDYMGNVYEYLPFGSGRRICPGIALAQSLGGEAADVYVGYFIAFFRMEIA